MRWNSGSTAIGASASTASPDSSAASLKKMWPITLLAALGDEAQRGHVCAGLAQRVDQAGLGRAGPERLQVEVVDGGEVRRALRPQDGVVHHPWSRRRSDAGRPAGRAARSVRRGGRLGFGVCRVESAARSVKKTGVEPTTQAPRKTTHTLVYAPSTISAMPIPTHTVIRRTLRRPAIVRAPCAHDGAAGMSTPATLDPMSITERIQADLAAATKAQDRPRVAALRLLMDSLQKEAKQARGELDEQQEIAVLKRQRKQCAEAAEAFRKGGRADAAAAEEAEVAIIDAYLPEQISEDELAGADRRRARRDRRRVAARHGQGDVRSDGEGGGPRGREAGQRAGQGATGGLRPVAISSLREQITLDPVVATELAGSEDTVLKALEGHLDCDVFLRGQHAHARRRRRGGEGRQGGRGASWRS